MKMERGSIHLSSMKKTKIRPQLSQHIQLDSHQMINSKNKEWAQTSDKRCDYRLWNELYLFHIDDEGKQSLRDEI